MQHEARVLSMKGGSVLNEARVFSMKRGSVPTEARGTAGILYFICLSKIKSDHEMKSRGWSLAEPRSSRDGSWRWGLFLPLGSTTKASTDPNGWILSSLSKKQSMCDDWGR